MPKISVLGGYTEAPREDECPGNSSLTSLESPEKTESQSSPSIAPKTGKSLKSSNLNSTANSVDESTK